MNMLIYIISTIVLNSYCVFFSNYLVGINYKDILSKNTILVLFLSITQIILFFYCPQPYKLLISIITLIFAAYIIVKNIKSAILITTLLEITVLILELVIMCLISLIPLEYNKTKIVNPLSNVLVALFGLLVLKTNIIRKIYEKIIKYLKTIKGNITILYMVFVLSTIIISTVESYMKLPILVVLITNTVMTITITTVILKFMSTKAKYETISNKYQTSITSLKEYEDMIDKYRIYNHENKNELLTIRNLVRRNQKAVDYIDNLVGNKIKDNEKIMLETSKIPEGGLRATIYAKINTMEKNGIDYKLIIAKNLKTIDLINMDENLTLNICKILGVFLDNSIECVKELEKKIIKIEIYFIEDTLYIDITNNFVGNVEIDKMSKTKYSTKGKNHGYGLLLVSKIIEENRDVIKNERIINKDMFTQSLKIKIKTNNSN